MPSTPPRPQVHPDQARLTTELIELFGADGVAALAGLPNASVVKSFAAGQSLPASKLVEIRLLTAWDIAELLGRYLDRDAQLAWFSTPSPELDGATPLAALAAASGTADLGVILGASFSVANGPIWFEMLGPFYSPLQVQSLLECSPEQLANMTARDQLLALSTADGEIAYPAFQFHGDVVQPGLDHLLALLNPMVDGWTLATWFQAEHPELDDRSPMDCLRAEGLSEQLLACARSSAAYWSL